MEWNVAMDRCSLFVEVAPRLRRQTTRERRSCRPAGFKAVRLKRTQMIVLMISMCLNTTRSSLAMGHFESLLPPEAPSGRLASGVSFITSASGGSPTLASDNSLLRNWRHLSEVGDKVQQGDTNKIAASRSSRSEPVKVNGSARSNAKVKVYASSTPMPLVPIAEADEEEESSYNADEELANELAYNEQNSQQLLNQTSLQQKYNKPINNNNNNNHHRNQLQSSQAVKAINSFETPDRSNLNTQTEVAATTTSSEDNFSDDLQSTALAASNSTNLISSLFSHIDKQWNFAEVILIIVISAILNLVTIIGNIMVLISFKMDRSLQTVSNYFLLSLALADLLIGLISMPLYTLYLLLNYWPLGALMCDIWLAIDYLNSNAAVLNMLIISFDRYFSVTRPLTYRAKRTTKHACLMISCAWILSLTIWTPAIFTYPYYKGARTVQGTDKCEIEFVKANSYLTFVTAILAFYIPVIIMIYLYWRIWLETKKRYRDLTTLFLVSGVGAAAPTRATRPMLHAISNQMSNAGGAGKQATPPINRQSSIKRSSGSFVGAPLAISVTGAKQAPPTSAASNNNNSIASPPSQQQHSDQRQAAPRDGAASAVLKLRPRDLDTANNDQNQGSLILGHLGHTARHRARESAQVKCKCPCCPRMLGAGYDAACRTKRALRGHCTKSACNYARTLPDCPRCLSELRFGADPADCDPPPELAAKPRRPSGHEHPHSHSHLHRAHHHHHHHHHHCNKAGHQQSQRPIKPALSRCTDRPGELPAGRHHHHKRPACCTCAPAAPRKLAPAHRDDTCPAGDKAPGTLSLLTSSYHQLLSSSSSSLLRKVHPTRSGASGEEANASLLSIAQLSSNEPNTDDDDTNETGQVNPADKSSKVVTTVDTATSPIEFPSSPVAGSPPPPAGFSFSHHDDDDDNSSEADDARRHEDDLETRIVAGGDRFRAKSDKLSVSQMLANFHNGVAVQKRPQEELAANRAANPSKRATSCAHCLQYEPASRHRKSGGKQRRCCCDIMMAHDAECRLCNITVDSSQQLHNKAFRSCLECRQCNKSAAARYAMKHQAANSSKTTSKSPVKECPTTGVLDLNGRPAEEGSNRTVQNVSEETRLKALSEVKLPILGPLNKCSEEPEQYVESTIKQKPLKESSSSWRPPASLLHKTNSSVSLASSLNGSKSRRKSPKKFNQRLTFASGAAANKTSPDSETTATTAHNNSYSSSKPSTYSSHHPIQPKSERKAAKTLSTLLLVFIVTWLPYNVLVLIKTLSGGEDQVPEKIWNFSYYLCYINSTINPLCYALCNAQFRRTYMRILKCKLSNEHNSTRRLVPIQSSTTWNKDLRIANSTDGNPTTFTSANSHNNHNNHNNNHHN